MTPKTPKLSFDQVRHEIIGRDFTFTTPFGTRLLTYADFTASGRSIAFIEKYLIKIQREYANTHTEDDITGRHMTGLLHGAEKIIKKAFNADKNCYIIATGTGTTGAITKFQEILGVRLPEATRLLIMSLYSKISENESESKSEGEIGFGDPQMLDRLQKKMEELRPVVFISSYEHHSNDIMWREAVADVVVIGLTPEGYFDIDDLKNKLSLPQYQNRMKIGSFSAASNVTGVRSPVYKIARLMHQYGGLACFDFAASAPYVKIDMNKDVESYFDAIYISPHKFVGGPGSTGILVFNEKLYNRAIIPTSAAGGTVDYVSSSGVDYSEDVETRERAGTPGILQTIKAGLAIDLKDAIGIDEIEAKEYDFISRALERLTKHPNIEILGPIEPDHRLSIISFMVKHGDKYLHPKFCTKLLNDLFGIQSRAGCMCSGPYGHSLLDIGEDRSLKFRKVVQQGKIGIKPGWTRLNFHYLISEAEFDFLCSALEFIAEFGHRFLSLYSFNFETGDWIHHKFQDDDLQKIPNIENVLKMDLRNCFDEKEMNRKELFDQYLKEAKKIAESLQEPENFEQFQDPTAEELRWFNFQSHQ